MRTISVNLPIDGRVRRIVNGVRAMSAEVKTRKSLLSRLRKASDDGDWQDFYDQYRHVILSFCRRRGLDEFSADDVLQETMVLLMRKLPEFRYDPQKGKFRNWLLTVVARKAHDARERMNRMQQVSLGDDTNHATLLAVKQDDASESVANDWRQALLEEALRRIKKDARVKPETFMVFQQYVVNGGSAAEVARAFRLEINAVYQIRNRMMRRLTEEVNALEQTRRKRCNL